MTTLTTLDSQTRLLASEISAAVNRFDADSFARSLPQLRTNPVFAPLAEPAKAYDILTQRPLALINLIRTHPAMNAFWSQFSTLWKVLLYQVLTVLHSQENVAQRLVALYGGTSVDTLLRIDHLDFPVAYYPLLLGLSVSLQQALPLLKRAEDINPLVTAELYQSLFLELVQAQYRATAWPDAWVLVPYNSPLLALAARMTYIMGALHRAFRDAGSARQGHPPPLLLWLQERLRELAARLHDAWNHAFRYVFYADYALVGSYGGDDTDESAGSLIRLSPPELYTLLLQVVETFEPLAVDTTEPASADKVWCRGEFVVLLPTAAGDTDEEDTAYTQRVLLGCTVGDALEALRIVREELQREDIGVLGQEAPIVLNEAALAHYETLILGPDGPYGSSGAQRDLTLSEITYASRIFGREALQQQLGTHHWASMQQCGHCSATINRDGTGKAHARLSIAVCDARCWDAYKTRHSIDFSAIL